MQWNKKDGRMTALNLVNATKTAAKVTLSLFELILFSEFMLSKLIVYSFIFHLVIKVPSNIDVKWKPNEENIFEFSSENIAENIESPYLLSNPNHNSGLKLKAQVKVQSFSDHTLRAQMNHIRFYTSNGPITLEAAHEILGSGGFSLFGASSRGIKEF